MKRSRVYNEQLESSYLFWTSPHLYIVSKKHRSIMMKICIYLVCCQFNSGFRTQLDRMITSRNQVVHQFLNKAMKNKDISNFEDFSQFRYLDSHMIGTVLLKKGIFCFGQIKQGVSNRYHRNLQKTVFFIIIYKTDWL